ncbi:hypothetical protein D3C78_1568880 [compost metagenome]
MNQETYVVIYIETKSIKYCGQDYNEANKWLEMPHYAKDEADKYQLSIYNKDGNLINSGITKKIKP